MEKKASEIQKERIQALEEQADRLLEQCQVLTLASVNEHGYPRICTILKAMAPDFHTILFCHIEVVGKKWKGYAL